MRKLVPALLALSVLLSYFVVFSSRSVSAADGQICYVFSVFLTNEGAVPGTATIYFADAATDLPVTETVSLTLNPGESGTLYLAAFVPDDLVIYEGGGPGSLSFDDYEFGPAPDSACGGSGSVTSARIGDGRINDGPDQLGAPLAAYCTDDGGIEVWDISSVGTGTLGFTSSTIEIGDALALAGSSGENQQVGEGHGNALYALSDGSLQLMGPDVNEPGKSYIFIAAGDVCG